MNIETKVEVTDARLGDLFCGAFEGGSNYWARKIDHRPDWDGENTLVPLKLPFTLWHDPVTGEDDKVVKVVITREKVRHGLQLMAQRSPGHFANIINENDDAETADVFLQYVALEEIVFG